MVRLKFSVFLLLLFLANAKVLGQTVGEQFVQGDLLYEITEEYDVIVVKCISTNTPESLTIPDEVIYQTKSGNVTITGGKHRVVGIADGAFWSHCPNELIIGNNVDYIGTQDGTNVFSYPLKTLILGTSVKTIKENTLVNATELTTISCPIENPYFSSEDAVLFDKDMTTLLKYPPMREALTYSVPSSVIEIASYAFDYSLRLQQIVLSENLKRIGKSAFSICRNLSDMRLNAAIESIEEYAFSGCTGIRNIYVARFNPDEYHCATTAFGSTMEGNGITLHVPVKCSMAYSTCEPWSRMQNIVEDEPTIVNNGFMPIYDTDSQIYDLNGHRVVQNPAPSIIVVKGKKYVQRK